MSLSATRTGPGISLSPAIHRLIVRASTSSAAAAATCDNPSAAIAARNSSADNDAFLYDGKPPPCERDAQAFDGIVRAKRRGERPICEEKRQALGAVNTAAEEPECAGGKDGNGLGLAHASLIGPMVLAVNNEISAAESVRGHGAEGRVKLPRAPAPYFPSALSPPRAARKTAPPRLS